jgi:hypothetical protein
MTQSIEAARIEMTPPGNSVTREEEFSWLVGQEPKFTSTVTWRYKFDPRTPISDLAARLLAASNGLHSQPVDGTPASEPGTTRHARFGFCWGR